MDFNSGQFWTSPITYTVFLPVVGALVLLLLPKEQDKAIRWGALIATLATGLVGLFGILLKFNYSAGDKLQGVVDANWIQVMNARYIVGIDGISLPLFALTLLVVPLCVIYSLDHIPAPGNTKAFMVLLLVLETGMLGSFIAQDLILFFVFFEIVLLPMYFMIGVWGGEQRQYASIKFFLYTLFGSALMIIAFVALYFLTPEVSVGGQMVHTFDMRPGVPTGLPALAGSISHTAQLLIFGGMFVGFGIKVPMFPFHTWLPDAHTQAPTVGSVILAAVLLKLGTYGFVRIALPILPEAAQSYQWLIGLSAVVGIIYGALCCLAQTDMKRLIAFSSVAHMGFVMLAIATLTPFGINAAIFGMVAHGLITGMLFFLAGSAKERYHTLEINRLGGMLQQMPRLGWILGFCSMASLGLPGLAGFWGEFPAILSAYNSNNPLFKTPLGLDNLQLFRVYMVVAAIGTVFAAGYLLYLYQRVAFGTAKEEFAHHADEIHDVNRYEWVSWIPLLVGIVVLGVAPGIVFNVTNQTVGPMLTAMGLGG